MVNIRRIDCDGVSLGFREPPIMDFISIDFETATSYGNSACEIGLTFVRDGRVEDTYGRLIRPPGNRFDYWNTKIHGIRPADVEQEASFDELWSELQPRLDGRFLIAHNASFDFSVLRKSLEYYRLDVPVLLYACSVQLSRKVWTGLPHYNLKALCNLHGIPLNHHRAEADSLATAQLCIKAFEEADIRSVEDIRRKLKTHVWQMRSEGNFRLGSRPSRPKKGDEAPKMPVNLENPASLFYRKRVVITGSLSTMKRLEAQQAILDVGGFPEEQVSEQTDFLIVGRFDFAPAGLPGLSQKQRTALEFITRGAPIRFLSEPEFMGQLTPDE